MAFGDSCSLIFFLNTVYRVNHIRLNKKCKSFLIDSHGFMFEERAAGGQIEEHVLTVVMGPEQ